MSGTHTIVLIQQNSSKKSCAYYDRDSVDEAMDEIVKRYEEKLKQLNPTMKNITYDIADLFTYIDTLHDLSCLVLNPEECTYTPHSKEWVKAKVFQLLRKHAS